MKYFAKKQAASGVSCEFVTRQNYQNNDTSPDDDVNKKLYSLNSMKLWAMKLVCQN